MKSAFRDLKMVLLVLLISLMVSPQMASGKGVAAIKYPYMADTQKEERILSNCNLLKKGMTKNDVIELLGQPDEINASYDRDKMSEKVGESFVYILRRDASSGSYMKKNEKLIRISFDNAGYLQAANATRLPAFHEIEMQREANMVLVADPRKVEWKSGEPIEVEIRLYNRGRKSVSVIGPLNHGNITFVLTSEDGTIIDVPVQKNAPKLGLKDVRIHTNHFYGTMLALFSRDMKKTSLSPGEYTLEARYRTQSTGKAQDAVPGVWNSEPVKIVVIN
ncbi:hypothetical protein P4C99_02920 [Pontiellaceae bacterium B1224]|nr:hypothetical protein [Pontiellaceae bacterium B1224]